MDYDERCIFKPTLIFIALLIGDLPYFCSAQKKSKGTTITHPNIIFFLVDDIGWEDSSVPFWDSVVDQNKKSHTSNMVKLAAKVERSRIFYHSLPLGLAPEGADGAVEGAEHPKVMAGVSDLNHERFGTAVPPHRPACPFSGGEYSIMEGGTRVPFIT